MDEQHNELMKYVLDEPEEAAFEIARLREDAQARAERAATVALVAFFAGLVLGAMF